MLDLGFPYYFFGSPNSVDIDVMIDHPHPSKTSLEEIEAAHPATKKWNISLIRIENGLVVETMPKKGTPDAVHNSLYHTYGHHRDKQVYKLPLIAPVQRHLLLAIEGCIKNLLTIVEASNLKGFYKANFRSAMRAGIWMDRLELLPKIPYDQPYFDDPDRCLGVYKSLAFDVGQTLSLINGREIYTKDELVTAHPVLNDVIFRRHCDLQQTLRPKILELYNHVKEMDIQQIESHIVRLGTETVNTRFSSLLSS